MMRRVVDGLTDTQLDSRSDRSWVPAGRTRARPSPSASASWSSSTRSGGTASTPSATWPSLRKATTSRSSSSPAEALAESVLEPCEALPVRFPVPAPAGSDLSWRFRVGSWSVRVRLALIAGAPLETLIGCRILHARFADRERNVTNETSSDLLSSCHSSSSASTGCTRRTSCPGSRRPCRRPRRDRFRASRIRSS
jgi:hypothetical protein